MESSALLKAITDVKIEIFIPEDYVPALQDELSKVGAGHIGDYDHCVSISTVKGYWRPLEGADPFLGEVGKISEGSECKVEVNCKLEVVKSALAAIHRIHPYEEPVINVLPLLNPLFE
ncbi:MAG TPA: YqfO family protein [Longilinea sp.]|nr:YqfO family protein [Longilinea sp.]